MIWSQNNNRIEETTIELESVSSSDDVITHAAFASEKSACPPTNPMFKY
jgi:mediator of RNA polymerase II transcription subunit 16